MASIFSGSSGRKAAVAANNELAKGLQVAAGQLGDSKNAAAGYLNQNPDIYQNSYNQAQGLLNSAYADAKTQMQGAGDVYNPFYETGVKANTNYANATGVNGAEGYADALSNFRNNPGYQYQMDQGLDAINRTAAARGGLASGNNTIDLQKYAQGQADQSWNNHLSGLNNQVNTGMQAANGLANANQNLSSLAMNYGTTGANLAQNLGNQLASNNTSLASNETNYGNTLSNMTMNTISQMSQNTGQGMMAGQTAAQNRFGAIMGGVQSGLGLLGKIL